jgi:hypothetical protein
MMNPKALGVACGVLALFVGGASAEALSGDAIRQAISGKKVYLSTPYGLEFPLHYRTSGRVDGDASGFSVAAMLAPKESGTWWVDGANMCQKWPSWYKGKTFCFTLEMTGPNKLAWTRNDGMKGTARIVP